MKKPFVLLILDGFGYNDNQTNNAITMANTPTWDGLWAKYPHSLIDCSGKKVGLPDQQMGNSEVGHMNIGAGRIIYQDLTKIDNEIESGAFFHNSTLNDLFAEKEVPLHVLGLVSDGGVHSHLRHYLALAKIAAQNNFNKLYIHAFLDGRDTPPKSALNNLLELSSYLEDNKIGKIVSLVGRFYAMDRDQRWERTQQAYDLLTGNFQIDNDQYFIASDLATAVNDAYQRGETDEFVKPTIIASSWEEYQNYTIKQKNNVLFMNFRSDRARQMSSKLANQESLKLNKFVTLTEYTHDLTSFVVYKPSNFGNVLGQYLQDQGLHQLRIAETEKYAHVTFFFNGGREKPFNNEDRILIPSPKVKTYDLQPEMSAFELTATLCQEIQSNKYDVIICNYANADMVGHTGSLPATIKAIEVIDQCLAQLISALKNVHGQMFITADHGNAECMYDDQTKQPHTAHTMSLVPLLYIYDEKPKNLSVTSLGALQDVAPSLLHLIGLNIPDEMTGSIIFNTDS